MMLYNGVLMGKIGEKNHKEEGKYVLNKALFIFWKKKRKKNKNI